jgi:uncharacterized protein (DUF1330 family)
MTAYVLVEIKVTDPEIYAQVKALTPPVVAAYGGCYLVRGGKIEVVSGSWYPERLVLLEFETMEAARNWEASPEYQQIKKLRDRSAKVNMLLIEGLPTNSINPLP